MHVSTFVYMYSLNGLVPNKTVMLPERLSNRNYSITHERPPFEWLVRVAQETTPTII